MTDFKGIRKTDEICVQEKLTVVLLEYKNFEVFKKIQCSSLNFMEILQVVFHNVSSLRAGREHYISLSLYFQV